MALQNITPVEVVAGLIKLDENFPGGAFTLVSKNTGKQFTYKLRKKLWLGVYYIHCFAMNRYLEFEYLGYYKDGKIIHKRALNDSIKAKGLEWLIKQIKHGKTAQIEEKSEILHLGKCLKCGRKLTDSERIKLGLGSYCQKLLNS